LYYYVKLSVSFGIGIGFDLVY